MTRLQSNQERQGDLARESIMEAMLLCSGEVGFRRVSIEQVYQRYGGSSAHFYSHFRDKNECFLAAYEWKSNQYADQMISLLEGEGPVDRRVNRALESLADFASVEGTLAKAIVVEVHMVGREGFSKRRLMIERLSRTLDATCRGSAQKPPSSLTAEFLIGAIDQALTGSILAARPGDFRDVVPELGLLICRAYNL